MDLVINPSEPIKMQTYNISKIEDEKINSGNKVLVIKKKENKVEFEDISSEHGNSSLNLSKERSFLKIYWSVLSLKQHIINYFSSSSISLGEITESYIPLPIKIIRSLFMIVLSFILNSLFLNQNYYSKKFKYFNEKYKLLAGMTDGLTISPYEIDMNLKIKSIQKAFYSISHTMTNAIIVFIILLVMQLILGVLFFSLRKNISEVIKKYDLSENKKLELKIKIKYIIFLVINFILMVLFIFTLVGFGGMYGGGFIDYFMPGIISIIFLEVFPFLWSLIIALLEYLGIKYMNHWCIKISQFFMF